MKLKILDNFPNSLLKARVKDLHEILQGPTLFHLKGKSETCIFISTLLHGNEHSGFYAIQKLLNEINLKNSKYSLLIFIGNTKAAQNNLRHLADEPDYNRIWVGGEGKEEIMISELMKYVKKQKLFCNIDIHNNTGKNPYYACINKTTDPFINLANFFFDKIVYFTEPHEVQSMAFANLCPSVTLEVGQSNDQIGIKILFEKLKNILEIENFNQKINKNEIEVYHTTARIRIDQDAKIDFNNKISADIDLSFTTNIEKLNFTNLKIGTHFAFTNNHQKMWLESKPLENCFDEYFQIIDGKIITKNEFTPSMLTQNLDIIKSDCFGYIMEKYNV